MNCASWLPPYTREERSWELCMRSLVLCRRAQRICAQNRMLRDHVRQLLKRLRAFSLTGNVSPHRLHSEGGLLPEF